MKNQFALVLTLSFYRMFAMIDSAAAQGTEFSYQGQLTVNGTPAAGNCDLSFSLFSNNNTNSGQVGATLTNLGVGVTNGLFNVTLDFGANFPGTRRWLAIGVRSNDGGGFTVLNPLQELTPVPYAIYASNAGAAASANSVSSTNITGAISLAQLSGTVITNNASGLSLSGSFTGNGSGLSNVFISSLVQTVTPLTAWGAGTTNNPADGSDFGQAIVPGGLGSVAGIASGGLHSLALRSDGTVAAWGAGTIFNPSDGLDHGQAIVPAGLSNVLAISAGFLHSMALKNDGTVVAWGAGATNDDATYLNDYGQSIVPAGLSNVSAISAGAYHSLALKNDGTVAAWGAGEIISANFPDDGQSVVPVGLSNVVAISGGVIHSLALKNDGSVVVWGDNTYGQTNVPAGLSNVVAIACGGFHSLALKNDGTVVAWGAGLTNNSADGFDFGQSIVPPALSNVVAISAGEVHSLALKNDGTIVAWGAGLTYNPTDGANFGQSIVPPGLSNVVAISAGAAHSMALSKSLAPPSLALLNQNDTFGANVTVQGILSGDGSGLTDLNATNLFGTVSLANLPVSVVTNGATGVTLNGTFGGDGGGLTDLNAANLIGSVSLANLPAAVVTNNATGATLNGTFSGNGAGLTGLNAANLAGVVSLADLPTTVVTNTATGVTLSGTFNGNGAGLTGLNAANLAGIISLSDLPPAVVTNTATGLTLSGSFNGNGAGLAGLKATNLTGTVSLANLPANLVTNTAVGLILTGAFSGNGNGLTNLNATNLTGTVPMAQLPGSVASLNANQTFAGQNNFTANVGITTSSPSSLLSLGGNNADDKLAIWDGGSATNTMGFGVGAAQFRIHLPGSNNRFSFLDAPNGNELMTVLGTGNVGIGTNNPQAPLHVSNTGFPSALVDSSSVFGTWLDLRNTSSGGTNWLIISTGNSNGGGPANLLFNSGPAPNATSRNVLTLAPNGNVGVGNLAPGHLLVVGSSGSPAYCDGTTWQNGSDRNAKQDFADVDPRAVLEKVSALPVTKWKYKVETNGVQHLGPMAQDFHAAFGLNGADDKHIATVDEEGVALAAIQGLNQKVEERLKAKDDEIQDLKQSVEQLKAMIDKLVTK